MRYLVSSEEMRRYDSNTIERIGIPGMVLMERAAMSAEEAVLSVVEKLGCKSPEVLVLAGMGNNGGDGLALARLLSEREMKVMVWCVGEEANASAQWKQQKHILEHYRVSFCDVPAGREYTVLVDALFGVGLSREVTGIYADALNLFQGMQGYKIALDIPSGICSDTGRVLGCAVSVDETVTFGFEKRGLYLFPGCEYAGKVRLTDVGITQTAFFDQKPAMFCLEPQDAGNLIPRRSPCGNKGTFGKLLLVAGSEGMAGAAVLGAKAAYRTGAGMVKVLTAECNRVILQGAVPEALYGTYENLNQSLEWADVIAIGPGLSKSDEAVGCLKKIMEGTEKPLLIDADGLNILADSEELQKALLRRKGACILTPHMGELSRLVNLSVAQLKTRSWEYGTALAQKLHCIVIVKDARTYVCGENGPICTNILGNNGMATAGSGDVLAGVLGGIWAQTFSEWDAFSVACSGVYVHAAAGDLVSHSSGVYGCMAGDMADAAAQVMRQEQD